MFRRFLAPLLALVVGVVLCTPWIIKSAIVTNLRAQGYDAHVERVGLTPGRIEIRNLAVERDGVTVTRVQNLLVRYRLGGLLEGRLAVRELLIDGLLVTAREHADGGWELLGIPAFNTVEASAEETVSEMPTFGIERLDLRDSRVRLTRPHGDSTIDLAQLYVGAVATWAPRTSTPYALVAHGDFGAVTLRGGSQPLASPPTLDGELDWRGARFDTLARLADGELLPPLRRLAGAADLALRFTATADPDAWAGSGHLRLALNDLALATAEDAVSLAGGNLQFDFQVSPDTQHLEGALDTRALSLRGPNRDARIETLGWQGAIEFGQGGERILAKGELKAGTVALDLPDRIRLRTANARWSGTAQRTADGALDVDGLTQHSGLHLTTADIDARVQGLAWQGRLQGHPERALALNGHLDATGLAAEQAHQSLAVARADWRGDASLDFAVDAAPGVVVQGDTTISDARVARAGEAAVAIDTLTLRQMIARANATGLQSLRNDLSVTGLNAELAPQRIAVAQLDIPTLSVQPPARLDSGEVRVRGLEATLVRPAAPSGDPLEPTAARADESTPSPEATPVTTTASATSPNEPYAVDVAGLNLRDGTLNFRDETVSPAFTARINALEVDLGAFTTSAPDTPSPVRLSAILGEFGQFDLNGQMRPLQPTAFADLEANLLGFDMPELNPYLRANLGDEVESGQLDVRAQVKIARNELDVRNNIEVRKLVLRKATDPAATDAPGPEGGGGSLLNTAVSLLSDSSDTIRLKLPVTGQVDDPQFDLSDAINQALGKSIATGVLLYFQPLGALVAIGKVATSQFSVLEFNPVAFRPGDANLDREAKTYLADLAKRLADRPNIQVKICGMATEADRAALQPPAAPQQKDAETRGDAPPPKPAQVDNVTLLKLAKQRAGEVTRHLGRVEGIAASRLVGCGASVAKDADARPEVRLGQ